MDKYAINPMVVRNAASAALKGIKGGGSLVKAHPFMTAAGAAGTYYGAKNISDAVKAGDPVSTPLKDFARGTLHGSLLPAGIIAAGAPLLLFPATAPIGAGMMGMGASWLPWSAVDGLVEMSAGNEQRKDLRGQLEALKANPNTNPHLNYVAAGLTGLSGLAGANLLTSRLPWLKKHKRLRTILNAALAAGAGAIGYYGADTAQKTDLRRLYNNIKV